jgi:hypothetical protein
MDEMEQKTGEELTISAKELFEYHRDGMYKFVINRNASLDVMLSISPELADYFNRMNWMVFHAPKSTSFVTTDNPLILLPPPGYDPNSPWGYGLLTAGVRKVFPLSQKACLVMDGPGHILSYVNVHKQIVRDVNIQVAFQAYRFVIARDEDLVRNIVRTAKLQQRKPQGHFRVG